MAHGNGSTQKRRRSAEEKWQIYQEYEQPEAKIGEILRNTGCIPLTCRTSAGM